MPSPPLIPLRHFFDNPERALARLSPDGRRISWLAPRDGVLNVWVSDVAGGEAVPVTDDRDRGVRSYGWTRDSRRIIHLQDTGGDENHHLLCVDVDDGGRTRDLTPFPGVRAGLVAVPRATPRHVLVTLNLRDRTLFDAYRLTLATGRLELVGRNPGNIIGWLADREGRLRAARAQTPAGDYQLLVRDHEDAELRVVAEYANEDGGHAFAFTPDGARLWVASARGSDLLRLVELDPADGSEREIDADDEVDLAAPLVSDRTGELLGAAYVRDRVVLHAFDERFARDWEAIRRLHPGDPHITGQDADETMFVVSFDDDRDPGAAYLYDRATGASRLLHRSRPWLDPETLAPMRPVTITSRDGLPLRSYLTLPLGAEPRDLPAVLVVHGGPWARDTWGYDPQAQMLANRGYAVLQVNYRGSTGFGKRFMHAAEREFAGRMHDDLIDAVEWLVGEGIADRRRVGIYGGSYGGYAALVGATFTPDVFAAVVSMVGPSSLVTLVRSFPPYWRPLLASTWFRYVGDPDDPEQLADLEARSPLNRVDRITAPLLVIQGANDPRVTKAESDQIVEALRARGVAVEYLVKDDEGHGFVKPENRMDAFRAIERFLARHLGGRAEG
ncbi:S9 family peptidase [Miltoncostaea marina]|uniref:S9 family peptidase n=1 Tax=Miltoncostaea marina TaxID=2843215 RepID=UPI001C3E7E8E|nr:S9 family peptidase [Miltoncostaea marina]